MRCCNDMELWRAATYGSGRLVRRVTAPFSLPRGIDGPMGGYGTGDRGLCRSLNRVVIHGSRRNAGGA